MTYKCSSMQKFVLGPKNTVYSTFLTSLFILFPEDQDQDLMTEGKLNIHYSKN